MMKTEKRKQADKRLARARAVKVKLANTLRGRPTNSEIRMRKLLRELQFRFCFQFAIGGYVADFIFVDRKLIVEVDGSSHVGREEYDRTRDGHLQGYGYRTLRIPDHRLNEDLDALLAEVREAFWAAEKCFDISRFRGAKIEGGTPVARKRPKLKTRRQRRGMG